MSCRSFRTLLLLPLLLCASVGGATTLAPTENFGPYNVAFLQGGIGVDRPLAADAPVLAAKAPWSITGWLRATDTTDAVLVSIGVPVMANCRCLLLQNGRLALSLGESAIVQSPTPVERGQWQAFAATYDGETARLYLDGHEAAVGTLSTVRALPFLHLAPAGLTGQEGRHFGGSLALLTLHARALSAAEAQRLAVERPDFDLVVFHHVGVGWPWQEHAWRGLQEPQDPWTLPHANTPATTPVAMPAPAVAALQPVDAQRWNLGAWRMSMADKVAEDAREVSGVKFSDDDWYQAVVPGTVLTTLIARGVYPDPSYGLNNLAIPESLARQNYWYRTHFVAPADLANRHLTLTFNGINYSAEVWLNGERLGSITGAFIRGTFDVTGKLHPGARNAIAVRISPPPHPGIPHEQSIAAGPGENGGNLALDGPTFVAAEGWDWIPGIRDRNSGIWQSVELKASGAVRLLDPQVITQLPLPRIDTAEVSIEVPVENDGAQPARITVQARFDAVSIEKSLTVAPGRTQVKLHPGEFPQLRLRAPRVWWPNGYGSPELYTLQIAVLADGAPSDSQTVRFGIREITYELSLFDHEGRLRRVEVDPTAGSVRGERLVDVRHEALKQTPTGWAASLTPNGEISPAVRPLKNDSLAPYLAIRVNGVPIAVRGGSWGTDDLLKRSSRARLEPYFRLHREANLNIIRNWLGQNTEEVFYELADEYGMLVLNDFWASTQDFQVEPQDPQLFVENARDVIARFRNHPSIAVWFGRNEGVPQPIINEGLAEAVASLDGTRYYTGSSNRVNLQGSGPYNYRPPEQYFTQLAEGFSVEVGTPSLSTLEALQSSIPAADRWPLSDTYAYHDWHFGGNGDAKTFMTALARQYGEGTSLEDFERKAQLMNYVTYRAIFEGFQAHLWTRNSGRLLWMTHPAWPSNSWQIYSSDYDTAAAYYGVKKACEPVHAQLNLPDFSLAVVNTTRQDHPGLTLTTRVITLDGRRLTSRFERLTAAANAVATLPALDLAPLLARERMVMIALTLTDAAGRTLSHNVYWQGIDEDAHRRLLALPMQPLALTVNAHNESGGTLVTVDLMNPGHFPALAAKLTLLDARDQRVLPVYYSDNYITLLPGDSQRIEIHCPAAATDRCAKVALRGWNVAPAVAPVAP